MSHVTSIALIMSLAEDDDERLAEINEWLTNGVVGKHGNPFGAGMRDPNYVSNVGRMEWVHDNAGGDKVPALLVAMIGTTRIPSIPVFLGFLASLKWNDARGVFVAVQDEDDERPSVARLDMRDIVVESRKRWMNDWDFWYSEDGMPRERSHAEWAKYHGYKSVADYLGVGPREPCSDPACECHTSIVVDASQLPHPGIVVEHGDGVAYRHLPPSTKSDRTDSNISPGTYE